MFQRLTLLLFITLVWAGQARAESPFSEDKTIRLVLGFSPGGISDLWARAMTPHIPGKPNIIYFAEYAGRLSGIDGKPVLRAERSNRGDTGRNIVMPEPGRLGEHQQSERLVCAGRSRRKRQNRQETP